MTQNSTSNSFVYLEHKQEEKLLRSPMKTFFNKAIFVFSLYS